MQLYAKQEKIYPPAREISMRLIRLLANLRTIFNEVQDIIGQSYYVVQVVSKTHTASIDEKSTHVVSRSQNFAFSNHIYGVMIEHNGELPGVVYAPSFFEALRNVSKL